MAIERAPNAAMEAGVLGNLGALLLGVAGRVEDSLDLIERSIKRFSEARLVANPLYAGALHRARVEQASARLFTSPQACRGVERAWAQLDTSAPVKRRFHERGVDRDAGARSAAGRRCGPAGPGVLAMHAVWGAPEPTPVLG